VKIVLIDSRKVLFEKFHIKHGIQLEFSKYLKDCNRLIDPVRFPNSILYRKHDRFLFEQDTGYKHFLIEDKMWNDIAFEYKLNYQQIQIILTEVIKEHLNIENYEPHQRPIRYFSRFRAAEWQEYQPNQD